jgi:hypothetical protein
MESLDSEDRLMEAMGTASHNGLFGTGGRFESAGPRSRFANFHSKQQQQQQQSSGECYFFFVKLWTKKLIVYSFNSFGKSE